MLEQHHQSSQTKSNEWVSDDCKHSFLKLQRKKTHRYVIFKIDEKRKEVIVDKAGGTAERFDDFMAAIPENDCRYTIYDFDFVTQENCQKSKIFFVAWRLVKKITLYSIQALRMPSITGLEEDEYSPTWLWTILWLIFQSSFHLEIYL